MSTVAPFLSEEDWDELLLYVSYRQVIPVIGPELVTVDGGPEGKQIPLVSWLAPRLAAHLKIPEPAKFATLNDTVRAFLLQKGDRQKIYNGIRYLMKHARIEPSAALIQLAGIADFDLFICTTFDPLLALALEQSRPGFSLVRDVLAYDTKPSTAFPDPLPGSLVYHILGNLNCFPDFAVWEEDYMEYLCHLVEQSRTTAMEGLFSQLRKRHLLLLGAPSSNWIVRFFLRAARGRRLTDPRDNDTRETIADRHENLGEPEVFFFNQLAKATRVVEGDPAAFTEELARRWNARRDMRGMEQDYLARLSVEMPRDAIFISYSHDDSEAALRLAVTLTAANIPVWLDKERLNAGENYERSLQHEVRERCSYFISLISSATEGDPKRYVHTERAWAATRFQEGFVFYLPVTIDATAIPTLEPACFCKIHCERAPGGVPANKFVARLFTLVETWRTSGRPRD